MKKVVISLMCLIFLSTLTPSAETKVQQLEYSRTRTIGLTVQGQDIPEGAFENENGTVMVPLGAIAKSMGYKTVWDSETQSVGINVDGKYLTFTVNSTAFSNGFDSELADKSIIINNRLYVPLYALEFEGAVESSWSFFKKTLVLNNR